MTIEVITANKGAICGEILASLPQWLGIEASNANYRREVEDLPMWGAVEAGKTIGFLALKQHAPHAFEIHVMGVKPEHHRSGAGRALVEAAAAYARERGARFLTVKTLSARDPDQNYNKTRDFYAVMEFVPLEEFPTLWNPENPALMLIRTLA